jgi:hypothetical protein
VISTVTTFCEQNPNQLPKDIRLTNFDDPTGKDVYSMHSDDSIVNIFEAEFRKKFPNAKDEL